MQAGVKAIGDSLFIHTTYSFNSAVAATYKYAIELITKRWRKVPEIKIL